MMMPPERAMQMLGSIGITPDKLPLVMLAIASLAAAGAAGSALPPPPPPIE